MYYNISINKKPSDSSVIVTSTSSIKFKDKPLTKVLVKDEIKQLHKIAELQSFEAKEKTYLQATINSKAIFVLGNDENIKDFASNIKTVLSLVNKTYNNQSVNIVFDNLEKNKLHQIIIAWHQAHYDVHDRHLLKKEQKVKNPPHLNIVAENASDLQEQLSISIACVAGMDLAKDIANLPANIATPTFLAETAQTIAKNNSDIIVKILEKKQIESLGMNSFLAVAKGSTEIPKLITLEYKPKKNKDQPIVLVGKGITFDSGGISLKPGESMDEMKYDMCGATTVLGIFNALAILKPNIHVVGVIASCENMPAGNAVKPGDVVKTMNGLTVEILNTDAEGRLILCDALTYCQKITKPKAIIDIATLTGACIIALGHHHSGLFSNNEQLSADLEQAGKAALDTVWRMPIDCEYQEQLKTNFADLANIGGRPAGSITAACFLHNFIENDTPWAHLDIAGTAWISGKNKGASARPIGLLLEFLLNQNSK